MARRAKHQEHEGSSERWLLTYADLITLLMAFFIIMYSMSNVNAAKYSALAESLKVALGVSQPGSAPIANMMDGGKTKDKNTLKSQGLNSAMPTIKQLRHMRDAKEEREFAMMVKQIKDYTKKKGIATGLEAKEDDRGVVINLSDKVLFESGKADLSPGAMAILDDLAHILLVSNKHIKVEGHTDNIPISNERYPSNWQLSTDRAANVIIYWLKNHPEASYKLSAAGYGEFRPVASNDALQGRARNRRVEIVVLRDLLAIGEPEKMDDKKPTSEKKPDAEQEPVDYGEKLPGEND